MHQANLHAVDGQRLFVAAERKIRTQESLAGVRRYAAVLQLDARIDELLRGQGDAECVAAVTHASGDFRLCVEQRLVTDDVRPVVAGEYGRAARMVGMVVRVSDGADRSDQPAAESGHDGTRIGWIRGGVDDDRAGLAANEGHVAGGIAHGDKDAVRHFDDFLAELRSMRAQVFPSREVLVRSHGMGGGQAAERRKRHEKRFRVQHGWIPVSDRGGAIGLHACQ